MRSKLNITFGEPQNGWLPVNIEHKKFSVDFVASDVPVDPLYLLGEAVFYIIDDRSREVWWHLEPAGYYMNLRKEHDAYELLLEFSPDSTVNNRKQIYRTLGDANEIVLPIWRALSEFYSHDYAELAWPKGDVKQIKDLKLRIKKFRLENGK